MSAAKDLVAASRVADQAALAHLSRAGADLNAAWRGYRPLHSLLQENPHKAAVAPEPRRLACLEWLLANGADPEQLGAWPPARAIIIAAFVGVPAYVKILRQGGAIMDGFAAAALGDAKRVGTALRQSPDFAVARDHGGLTALQCAAGSRMPGANTLEVARMLIDAGADVAARTRSWSHEIDAAYLAAGARNQDVFDLLLEHGADATAAFANAVWGKAYDLALSALRLGAIIDQATANGKPLLNDLIRWGQFPQVNWLLERHASPNVPDADGWTAVHQAASRGNLRILEAVLAAGGDPGHRDRSGRTPRDICRSPKLAAILPARSK